MSRKLILAALFGAIIFLCEVQFFKKTSRDKVENKVVYTKEPLLIEGEFQRNYSILPAGTQLHFYKGWDEGHTTYYAYFHFKGGFKSTPSTDGMISPLWLRTLDTNEVENLNNEYPISREELALLLKAKRVTKQDLLQLLRDWKDE